MNKIYDEIVDNCQRHNAKCIVVSKYRTEEQLMEYYDIGQRDFAENRVQELLVKQEHLPKDIKWHMIGHLQSNKVKYIAPFITMIHSIHSLSLLKEVNKQAAKNDRIIPVCIQFNLAKEETKSGFEQAEWKEVMEASRQYENIHVVGIMVIGPHTENRDEIRENFKEAKDLLTMIQKEYSDVQELSMGMSSDYDIALEEGSTMVRVGSILF